MRAYYNMLSLDLFGVAFQEDDPKVNSVILRGAEAVEYIKSELLAIEPLVREDTGPGRLPNKLMGFAGGLQCNPRRRRYL